MSHLVGLRYMFFFVFFFFTLLMTGATEEIRVTGLGCGAMGYSVTGHVSISAVPTRRLLKHDALNVGLNLPYYTQCGCV